MLLLDHHPIPIRIQTIGLEDAKHWTEGPHIHLERLKTNRGDKHIPTDHRELLMKVSGYLLVEKHSEHEYYFYNEKTKRKLLRGIMYYRGIGRLCEFPTSSPEAISKCILKAREAYSENLMFNTFHEKSDSEEVAEYINSIREYTSVEVLAVHAHCLGKYSTVHTQEEYEFIGYDITTSSCFPIKEELFAKKIAGTENKTLDKYASRLNSYGIFSDLSTAQE